MKKELKEKLPSWTQKDLKLNRDLMLGDDSDSGFSCDLLKDITNGKWDVNYFYDFQSFYCHDEAKKEVIGVDMSFTKNVRCFDNHISQKVSSTPVNPFMANLNIPFEIAADQYYKKYPFSTLLLIMAIYDIPLPKSDIGKDIILSVDSAFKGHYTDKPFFKSIHTEWFERIGMTELIDRLDSNNIKHFYQMQQDYKLNEKIHIEENRLHTEIDYAKIQPHLDWKIGLPDIDFRLLKECVRTDQSKQKVFPEKKDLVSIAYTSKNFACFTIKKEA